MFLKEMLQNWISELTANITPVYIIAQSIGIMAMILCIASFQGKKRNTILILQMIGMALWTLHFTLLGGYAGAAMNGLAAIRAIFYTQKGKKKWADSILLPVIFIVLFWAAGVITFLTTEDGLFCFVPSIAMTITSVSLFFKKEKLVRIFTFFASPVWIVYNLHAGSFPGVITESFIMVSILVALFRYREKKTEG